MIDPHTIFWSGLMLLGFAASALYSGLETGAYRLNRIRLQVLEHEQAPFAAALHRLVQRPTVLLTTLLIGNNLANQLGTAGLTALLDAAGVGLIGTLVLTTLIITPLLFIFGETLPKDLFAAHADRLMYPLTPVLIASRWLFTVTGFVPLIGLFTTGIMRLLGQRDARATLHPRRHVEHLVREGVGYGLVSDDQSAIVQRVLELSDRRVIDEMLPWADVIRVRATDSLDRLWELADRHSRSRLPVVDRRGRVVGVVHVDEALRLGRDACPPLDQLMLPPTVFTPDTPLRTALGRMQREHIGLAVVTDPNGRPLGIVTVKDLVEPITGELWSW